MLKGKVALVTGAGSGIGEAIALCYAEAGAKVVVSDIDEAAGERTTAQIIAAGGMAKFIRADTSSVADNEALVAATLAHFGAVHIACNNAGVGGSRLPVVNTRSATGTGRSPSTCRASSTGCDFRFRPCWLRAAA